LISGRIISAISGLISLFLLRALCLRVYNEEASRYTSILFCVSPLILWLNTRVFADSLFLVFVLAWILAMLNRDLLWSLFFSGLAVLTRPDGLLLLPAVGLLGIVEIRRGEFRTIIRALFGLIPWALFVIWMMTKPDAGYESQMGFSIRTANSMKVIEYAVNYIDLYPYVLFYPVAFFAFYHLVKSQNTNRTWRALLLYLHIAYLAMLGVWWAWQTRFLQVPLTLLLVEAGAGMALWQKTTTRVAVARVVNIMVFVCSAVFALTAFFGQVDVFADIQDSSQFLRSLPQNSEIYSDEQIKVAYTSGRAVTAYDRNHSYKAGDIIALHSFYSPLQTEAQALAHKYKLEVIHVSNGTTLPILGNIPLINSAVSFSNQKAQDRFQIQSFQSVVFKVH
jgi:hypothetical protein